MYASQDEVEALSIGAEALRTGIVLERHTEMGRRWREIWKNPKDQSALKTIMGVTRGLRSALTPGASSPDDLESQYVEALIGVFVLGVAQTKGSMTNPRASQKAPLKGLPPGSRAALPSLWSSLRMSHRFDDPGMWRSGVVAILWSHRTKG